MDYLFIGQIFISSLIGAALVALLMQVRATRRPDEGFDRLPLPVWSFEGKGAEPFRNAACRRLGAVDLPRGPGRVELGGQWFEVIAQSDGGQQVFCALPLDGVLRAETALRAFRSTLSDTFAHLDAGLGLFDAEGHLQMFNPALTTLTGLPVEFLLRKPSLGAVLDALRDRGTLPEPKDWLAWRRGMLEWSTRHEAEAQEDIWALPGGVTYRATLRGQAKGAFALLIQDISTEITRSRRHRADMELAQSVIDTLEEGIAVFAVTGQLVLSNAAYAALWGHDPGGMIDEGSISRIAAHWRAQSAPDPLWSRIEDFVAMTGERAAWQAEARLRDGRLIACRVAPIWDGATMAVFRPVLPGRSAPRDRAKIAG